MPVEVWTNDGLGTVTAGGTTAPAAGTVETWTVTATNAFPVAATAAPAATFYVADQNASFETEKILVTVAPGGTGAGQTWTVTRGADGTTPLAHSANFTIVQVVTRASLWALAGIPPSGDTSGATDSANIAAALAGGAQRVLLRAGLFYINASIALSGGQVLAGSGGGPTASTTIQAATGFAGAMVKLAVNTAASVTIRDLFLNGNNITGVTHGIQLSNTVGTGPGSHLVYGVTVEGVGGGAGGAGGDGIHLDVCPGSEVVNCNAFLNFAGSGIAISSDQKVIGCTVGQNFGHGINMTGVNSEAIGNKVYESGWNGTSYAGTTACGINCNGMLNAIVGNDCQQNALHGIMLDGTSGTGAFSCTVTGNHCDTNSIATLNVGAGIYVNASTNNVVAGNSGNNNGGIPGSQLFGLVLNGVCTATVASPNSITGSSGATSTGAGTGFTAASLNAGFSTSSSSGGAGTAGFKVLGDMVKLKGIVTLTATEAAFTTIFTLPSGAAPKNTMGFSVPNTLSGYTLTSNAIVVTNAGAVQIGASGVNTNQVDLSGVIFALD